MYPFGYWLIVSVLWWDMSCSRQGPCLHAPLSIILYSWGSVRPHLRGSCFGESFCVLLWCLAGQWEVFWTSQVCNFGSESFVRGDLCLQEVPPLNQCQGQDKWASSVFVWQLRLFLISFSSLLSFWVSACWCRDFTSDLPLWDMVEFYLLSPNLM